MKVFPMPDPSADPQAVYARVDQHEADFDGIISSLAGSMLDRVQGHAKVAAKLERKLTAPIAKRLKDHVAVMDQLVTDLNGHLSSRLSEHQGQHAQLLGMTIARGITQPGNPGTIIGQPVPVITPPGGAVKPPSPFVPQPSVGPVRGIPPGGVITPATTPPATTATCCGPSLTTDVYTYSTEFHVGAGKTFTNKFSPASGTMHYSDHVPGHPNLGTAGWYAPVTFDYTMTPTTYTVKGAGYLYAVCGAYKMTLPGIVAYAPINGTLVEFLMPCGTLDLLVDRPVGCNLISTANAFPYGQCSGCSPMCNAMVCIKGADNPQCTIPSTPPPPPPPPTCCPPATIIIEPSKLPCGEDVCYTDSVAAGAGPTCPAEFMAPDGTINLPIPGSLEWCAMQGQIIAFFQGVGDKLVAWADEALNSGWDNGEEYMEAKSWIDIGSNVIDKFGRVLWRTVIAYGIDVKNEIRKLLCEYNKMASQVLASAAGLVTLGVVRGLVRCLRDIQIGINWPIRLTVSIPIEIPQLLRALDYITESLFPSIIPSPGDAWVAWAQGQIKEELRDCWLKASGVAPNVHYAVAVAGAPHLSAEQVREYGYRNGWEEGQIDDWILKRGWIRDQDRAATQTLFFSLPGSANLAQRAWTHVLDGGYIGRYSLDVGFQEYWAEWGKRTINAQGVTEMQAYQEYVGSARMPTGEQAKEYLYRLRPGKRGVEVAFTDDDYRWMLLAAGYGPAYVDWAMESRYQEMIPSDLQRLWETHNLSDDLYASGILDRGADPADMPAIMQSRQIAKARTYASEGILPSPAIAIAGSIYQVWTVGTALSMIEDQGYTPNDVDMMATTAAVATKVKLAQRAAMRAQRQLVSSVIQGYTVGTVSRDAVALSLASAGWTDASIATFLGALDVTERTKTASGILKSIRSAYMQGRISDAKLPSYLSTAGITQERAALYIQEWQAERIVYKPDMSLGDIKRWVKEGVVTISQAEAWLANLGYKNPTATLLVDEMEWQLQQAMTKADRSKHKSASAAIRTIGKAQVAARRLEAAAKSQAQRDLPMSTLKAAYKCGALTRDDILSKLSQMGYSSGAAEIIVETWDAGAKGTCSANADGNDTTGGDGSSAGQ